MAEENEKPYEPRYKGFDEEATKRAQETAERAQKGGAAKGEDANADYVDEGPDEAARRMSTTREHVGQSVDRAARRKKQD